MSYVAAPSRSQTSYCRICIPIVVLSYLVFVQTLFFKYQINQSGRRQLKCDGTRAETRVRLSAKRTSPFKSAGESVQSTTGSRDVCINGGNSEVVFLLHFPSRASPCAITFQLESTTSQYHTVTVTATVDIQTTLHMLRSKVKLMRSLRGCRLVVSRFGKLYSEQRLHSFPSSLGTYHCRKCKRVSKAKIAPASQIFGPMKLSVLLFELRR